MARPTQVRIDLNALANNARCLRTLARGRQLMAVVKANAYGHGLINCAQALGPSVDALAVAFLEEAVTLREAGISQPILVLEGPLESDEVEAYAHLQLWPVIHRPDQLHWFENRPALAPPALWLKVDTGMHRLGLDIEAVPNLIDRANQLTPHRVTLMSHLATAGDLQTPVAQRQLRRWQSIVEQNPLETSLANSAAALVDNTDASHWLRAGYLFYGGHPDGLGGELPLAPVMRLESAVIAVRDIAAGEQVGYGGRWTAQRNSRIATLPVGYADGYPRSAKDGTPVLIDGHEVPLAGCVSMDMITVDVTDHPEISVGSPACLWGDNPSIDTVANHADTIGYELSSQVTPRVRRIIEPIRTQGSSSNG